MSKRVQGSGFRVQERPLVLVLVLVVVLGIFLGAVFTGDYHITGNSSVGGDLTVTNQLRASGLLYPTSDGASNQVIVTDGSGSLSFAEQTGSGQITLSTNYITAIRSAYGAAGWDYASIPFGETSNNLMTFSSVAESSSTMDRSALILVTLQTNQQSRDIRALLVPPVVATSLLSLRFIFLTGDNTNDFGVIRILRPDSLNTHVFTQTWATAQIWITNELSATGIDVLTNGIPSHWSMRMDVRNSLSNSISAPQVQAIWE